jgi:hypothetical protein
VTFVWERLADGVFRCRLPFLDVTVGLVYGRAGAMLIDTGTTLTEARAIAALRVPEHQVTGCARKCDESQTADVT